MLVILFLIHFAQAEDRWAILIDSSKFYFNYRHTVNTLLVYQLLKKYDFPDDHIILMLPENHQCHPRNNYPGKIFDGFHADDLMQDIEIDYIGADITPDAIIQLLTGRASSHLPFSKRLNSNKDSKVFVYFTGHGGNGYFKFQDTFVLKSSDLAYAVTEMNDKKRFKELLIILDTCQAHSMFDYIDLEGVHTMSSSLVGEPAKSYGSHSELGISTTDHFTYFFSELFRGRNATGISKTNLENIIKQLPERTIQSHIGYKSRKNSKDVLISSFITYEHKILTAKNISTEIKSTQGKTWNYPKHIKELETNAINPYGKSEVFIALAIFVLGTLTFSLINMV